MSKINKKYFYSFVEKNFLFLSVLSFLLGFLLQHIGIIIPNSYVNAPSNVWVLGGLTESWLNVSYFDEGLVRRAAVGTVLSPFPEDVRSIIYVFISAFSVLFIILALSNRINEHKYSKYLRILIIFTPFGLLNVGWDFGRLDWINFSLLYVSIYLSKNRNFLYSSIVSSLGIWVHEAFLFYGIPLVVTNIVSTSGKPLYSTLKYLFMPTLLALYLLFEGNPTTVDAYGANRGLFQYQGFDILVYSLSAYYIFLISIFHFNYSRKENYLHLIAPFGTLILFVLGIDYMRWITIFFFTSIFALITHKESSNRPSAPRYIGVLVLLSISLVPFGPLGVVKPFPAFRDFLQLLSKAGLY